MRRTSVLQFLNIHFLARAQIITIYFYKELEAPWHMQDSSLRRFVCLIDDSHSRMSLSRVADLYIRMCKRWSCFEWRDFGWCGINDAAGWCTFSFLVLRIFQWKFCSELEKELHDTNILITIPFHPAYMTKERIEKAKNLELLLTAGVGSDHIDLHAAAAKGLTVSEVTGEEHWIPFHSFC